MKKNIKDKEIKRIRKKRPRAASKSKSRNKRKNRDRGNQNQRGTSRHHYNAKDSSKTLVNANNASKVYYFDQTRTPNKASKKSDSGSIESLSVILRLESKSRYTADGGSLSKSRSVSQASLERPKICLKQLFHQIDATELSSRRFTNRGAKTPLTIHKKKKKRRERRRISLGGAKELDESTNPKNTKKNQAGDQNNNKRAKNRRESHSISLKERQRMFQEMFGISLKSEISSILPLNLSSGIDLTSQDLRSVIVPPALNLKSEVKEAGVAANSVSPTHSRHSRTNATSFIKVNGGCLMARPKKRGVGNGGKGAGGGMGGKRKRSRSNLKVDLGSKKGSKAEKKGKNGKNGKGGLRKMSACDESFEQEMKVKAAAGRLTDLNLDGCGADRSSFEILRQLGAAAMRVGQHNKTGEAGGGRRKSRFQKISDEVIVYNGGRYINEKVFSDLSKLGDDTFDQEQEQEKRRDKQRVKNGGTKSRKGSLEGGGKKLKKTSSTKNGATIQIKDLKSGYNSPKNRRSSKKRGREGSDASLDINQFRISSRSREPNQVAVGPFSKRIRTRSIDASLQKYLMEELMMCRDTEKNPKKLFCQTTQRHGEAPEDSRRSGEGRDNESKDATGHKKSKRSKSSNAPVVRATLTSKRRIEKARREKMGKNLNLIETKILAGRGSKSGNHDFYSKYDILSKYKNIVNDLKLPKVSFGFRPKKWPKGKK